MDLWKELCFKAFDGEEAANHLILYLEGCGKHTTTQYSVKQAALSQENGHLLEQMGFIREQDEYMLAITEWTAFLELKRTARQEWHDRRQQELRQQLKETLKQVVVLNGVTERQRVELVTEFGRRFCNDPGAIPLMRGLTGFLQYQLFKDQLVDWQCYEYTLTQNGKEVMVEYVRLLKGILGLQVVPKSSQVAILIQDDDDPTITWRMNEALSDQALSDMLRALPVADKGVAGYTMSGVHRPFRLSVVTLLHHPRHVVQWIRQVMLHCFWLIRK